jgi:predicted HAD superfamily Cof-like phosphohydrolase
MTPVEMVRAFHEKHGHPTRNIPGFETCSAELRLLRVRLIMEEAAEAVQAIHEKDIVETADALADLLYVVYGAALAFGIPLDSVVAEVHRSNMTKPSLNVHGKGGKGDGYTPPDIRKALYGGNDD